MATTEPAGGTPSVIDTDTQRRLNEAYAIRNEQIAERFTVKRQLSALRNQVAELRKNPQTPVVTQQVARLNAEIQRQEDVLAGILLKISHAETEIAVFEMEKESAAQFSQRGLPGQTTSDILPPAVDAREGFLTDAEKRPGGYLRIEGSGDQPTATPKKPNTVRDVARSDEARAQRPSTTAQAPAATSRTTQPPISPTGRGTASSGPASATLNSHLGGSFRGRLAALKVSQERERSSVAGELSKLSRTHPPSRFAFLVILCLGIGIDVLNYLVDVTIVVDLILSVVFLLCIRALINRPKGVQRLFGAMLLVAIFLSTIPIIGSLVGGPLFMIVLFFGVLNPGVKVGKVDKEKIQQSLKKFQQSIQKARAAVARLTTLGRKTKGLRTVSTKLAKSKAFKAFSKNSKTMSRLVGSAIAEAIPIIAWIPFNTINVFWTYFDLKKAHIEAKQLLEEYTEQAAVANELETATLNEEHRAQMEGLLQYASQQQAEEARDAEEGARASQATSRTSRVADVRESAQRGTMRDIRTPQPVGTPRIASPLRSAPVPARS